MRYARLRREVDELLAILRLMFTEGGRRMRLIDLFYQACIELNEEFRKEKLRKEEEE